MMRTTSGSVGARNDHILRMPSNTAAGIPAVGICSSFMARFTSDSGTRAGAMRSAGVSSLNNCREAYSSRARRAAWFFRLASSRCAKLRTMFSSGSTRPALPPRSWRMPEDCQARPRRLRGPLAPGSPFGCSIRR